MMSIKTKLLYFVQLLSFFVKQRLIDLDFYYLVFQSIYTKLSLPAKCKL